MSTRRYVSIIAILVCFSLFCSMFLTGCSDDALTMANELETTSSLTEVEDISEKTTAPTPTEAPTPTPKEETSPTPTETPATTPTETPTATSTEEPSPTPTEEPTPTPSDNVDEDDETVMVWIPRTGHKYHSKASCSNMRNPKQVPLEDAISMGYEPCKRCY